MGKLREAAARDAASSELAAIKAQVDARVLRPRDDRFLRRAIGSFKT